MQIGAVYPQIELRGDPSAVRRLALAVEELGFDYLLAYDHAGLSTSSARSMSCVRRGPPGRSHGRDRCLARRRRDPPLGGHHGPRLGRRRQPYRLPRIGRKRAELVVMAAGG